jgi:uncharacterized protein (DUF1684 family)
MTMRAARLMVALLAVGAVACSSGPPPPPSATEALRQVEEQRAATERFMRESKESPIPPDKVDVLLPLRYYEPSPAYRVPAQLRLSEQRPVAEMPTSTGTMMRYERVGVLQFTLDGEEHSLGAFVPEGTRNVYVPPSPVRVPTFVPFTVTCTPASGARSPVAMTLPVIVRVSCACAITGQVRSATRTAPRASTRSHPHFPS